MVGGANLTAPPAWSRPLGACELFQYSVARLFALKACTIAGLGPGAGGPYWLDSMAHTIPIDSPRDEIEGVAPGKVKMPVDFEAGAVMKSPVEGLKANCFR